MWFSTLCLYYYAHVHQKVGVGASSVKTNDPSNDKDEDSNKPNPSKPKNSKDQGNSNSQAKSGQDSSKGKSSQTDKGKQHNKKLNTLGEYTGRVMVGDKRQPICIPAGMSKVVVGKTQGKLPKGSYMVEATDDDNLPCGVSLNHTYVNPTKARQVSVILLNTNSYNVWIWQPLYAATIWDVKLKDWEYEPIITKSKDSDTFEVKLQQVPPEDLHEEILSNATEIDPEIDKTDGKNKFKEKDKKPSFGTRLDTKSPAFDFKKELEWLPFELNIGDAPLTFYLDNICIFAETANQMLDCIELVFSWLKEFNLKIKPKKSYFFQTCVTFLGHILSADSVSPNPEKVAKVKDWPVPKTCPSKSRGRGIICKNQWSQ